MFLAGVITIVAAIKSFVLAIVAGLAAVFPGDPSPANVTDELPLPRFVSLDTNQANVRVGPGLHYPIEWVYVRSGLPLEIINEFGSWRRIRDWQGEVGWIYHALLSGNRTGMVEPWSEGETVPMRVLPRTDARVAAQLASRVVVNINACDGKWCEVSLPRRGLQGYVEQSALWGAYPRERLNPSDMG